MVRMSCRRLTDDRGAVAVLTAVLAVMLFGLAAFVVDLGIARDNRRQAQNTADAAALGGGQRALRDTRLPISTSPVTSRPRSRRQSPTRPRTTGRPRPSGPGA